MNPVGCEAILEKKKFNDATSTSTLKKILFWNQDSEMMRILEDLIDPSITGGCVQSA